MTRITVEEAAKQLDMPKQAVRSMVRSGALPIGVYRGSERRGTYYIYKEKLDEFTPGREENE